MVTMHSRTRRTARWILVLATGLGGGTLFGTCELRLHDAIINGTKLWVTSLLDPSNISIDGTADTTTD
jgi:hypothetical protein